MHMILGDVMTTTVTTVIHIHRAVGSPCMLEMTEDVYFSMIARHKWAQSIKREKSTDTPPLEAGSGPGRTFV